MKRRYPIIRFPIYDIEQERAKGRRDEGAKKSPLGDLGVKARKHESTKARRGEGAKSDNRKSNIENFKNNII